MLTKSLKNFLFLEGFHLEEKRKSLDELLKYRIKMENENQPSDFFFFWDRLDKYNKKELP